MTTINSEVAHGTVVTFEDAGFFSVVDTGQFYTTADIGGLGRRGAPSVSLGATVGVIDWSSRELITLQGYTNEITHTGVFVAMFGDMTNLPPIAVAGADRVVECSGDRSARVDLSAAGSTDPDGAADLVSFSWSTHVDGVVRERFGSAVGLTLPLGTTDIDLAVSDRSGAMSIDSTTVEVADTIGPEISDVEISTDCLWPPDHSMHLFRLGAELLAGAEDACEGGAVDVRIVEVRSNQPSDGTGDGSTAPDVRFGSGALCLRAERSGTARAPREYSIVIEAPDPSGNSARETVTVRVPHDQRPSKRCTGSAAAPVVGDDDPRCTALAFHGGTLASTALGADAGASGSAGGGGGCSIGDHGSRGPTGAWWAMLGVTLLLGRRRYP